MNHDPATGTRDTVSTERLRNGLIVQIRPLREQDREREREFLLRLPRDCLARRFITLVKSVDDDVVRDLTNPDPACEGTLAAFVPSPTGDGELEVGAAAYLLRPDGIQCDCTVTVDPRWQKLGVGRALMRHLIELARLRGVHRMYATTGNHAGAHALGEYLGFHARPDPEDQNVTTYELVLR